MTNILERLYLLAQTSRVLGVLAAAGLVVAVLAVLSLKLLGVLLAAAGLAVLLWFPGMTAHQPAAFTRTMVRLGAVLIVVGLLLIALG